MNALNKNMKIQMLVLKIASRCNLNCTYCYVYNLGDNTYLKQPKVMSVETVEKIILRVKEHAIAHNLDKFTFIFHGGEPLLAGKNFFRNFVTTANANLLPEITPLYCLQTNGTLLTEDWCKTFGALGINIGISVDGPKEIHDARRVDHKGRGSYDNVIKGYNIAQASNAIEIKPGLLSVIDINADPSKIYRHFKKLRPRSVDFLFPEATYDRPPEKKEDNIYSTPYADWLITIFDQWFYEKEKPFSVRLFETYMLSIFGISTGLDTIGDYENEVLIIETNGGIEPVGSLKICGNGFTKVGANIQTNSFDDALKTELAYMYHQSGKILSQTCVKCPIKKVCGSGYLPHRYSHLNGFDNPSVYCSDLMKLITYIQNRLLDTIPEPIRQRIPITYLTFEQLNSLMKPYLHPPTLSIA